MAEGSIAVEAPPISSPVSAPESPQISIASDIEHLEHAVNNLKQAETAGPEIIPNTNLDAETKISIPDDNNITGKTQGEDASNKETDIQSSTEEPSVIPFENAVDDAQYNSKGNHHRAERDCDQQNRHNIRKRTHPERAKDVFPPENRPVKDAEKHG